MSSGKWRPFCLGPNVLKRAVGSNPSMIHVFSKLLEMLLQFRALVMFFQLLCNPWSLSSFSRDWRLCTFNTLRPRQNGSHFTDDSFKCIFLNENVSVSIKISVKFDPKGPNSIIPALVQIMAWRRPGDKPLSEPMVGSLLTHICVTRPQWVNTYKMAYVLVTNRYITMFFLNSFQRNMNVA